MSLIDKFLGRDPADVLAKEFYRAMCAPPPYVALAEKLTRASASKRAALLERADDASRVAALTWLSQPEALRERDRRLAWIREDVTNRLPPVRRYYSQHIDDFISDLGLTTDPRRIALNQPAQVPFALFPKQRQLVSWVIERWRTGTSGVVVKGRDVGASYVAMAILASLCLFERNFAAGVASATEAKLDLSGSPDTLFSKLREFLGGLPPEFNGGYEERKHSLYCRIQIPETGSSITGEAGALAGRGARKSLYIVDESAFFMQSVDAALAATANCRIDISTPNGIGNSFYDKAHNAAIPRFDLSWRDRPDRDQAWYDKQVATLDPVVLAQEVNADFAASREGVVIPGAWAQSAVGLHTRLGIEPLGARYAALDLGDVSDRCALAIRHGPYLEWLEAWSGAGSDMARSAERAFAICDTHGITELLYDADGLGGPFDGFARLLNDKRPEHKRIRVFEYRGSGTPYKPSMRAPRTKIPWKDYVLNRKAQTWMHARWLFEQSNLAANGLEFDRDSFISINPKIPELSKLLAQLSQPTRSENAAGRIIIDKLGDGERSPDLGDACTMAFAPRPRWAISNEVLEII
jgi:phage terminase large subunit